MTQLSLLKTDKHRMSELCARCSAPATGWSGAWLVAGEWIGWCGNDCRRKWLAGDKTAWDSQSADGGGT